MVDKFVLRTDPVAYMCPNDCGPWVMYEDYANALALIAEMKELLAYTAPFCEVRDDHDACMRLVARAEELLK